MLDRVSCDQIGQSMRKPNKMHYFFIAQEKDPSNAKDENYERE